jgi:hypothetical protein
MPLLKSPKAGAITPERILHMTRLTDDDRIAEDAAALDRLLTHRDGILLAIRQRTIACADEQEAARRELRALVAPTTASDADDAWTPDLTHDATLLSLRGELAALEQDLVACKRRIDATAPGIRAEALRAGATVQLQDLERIIALLREARSVAQTMEQHSQRFYGLVQDFLGPIRLVSALASYSLDAWDEEYTRLRRIVEGK